MKKILYTLLAGVMALSSCSKSDDAPNAPRSGEQLVKFNIQAPAARAGSGPTRYIVEAYRGNDLSRTPLRVEAATGSLTISLKNLEYTFLFWADNGTINANNGYWDATSLKEVKIVAGKESTVGETAYCHKVSFNAADFATNKDIALKNATAQINFVEMTGLTAAANTLTVKYASGGILNVATGKITEVTKEVIHTFSNIAKAAQGAILATDYILAPLGEKRLVDLKLTFNTEAQKTITSVPLQQSYKTNVKGKYSNLYSSTINISNEIEDYNENPDVEFPAKVKVGDFYYTDNTFSSTYIANAQNPCIGIVCLVNADGRTGKIVSLDEVIIEWSTENVTTGANSNTDGAANTAKIFALSTYTATKYPVFAWCATKNVSKPDGIDWYIPALDELKDEIYINKQTLNTALAGAGLTQLSDIKYWSSNEESNANALYIILSDGEQLDILKAAGCSVRAISAF